MARTIDHISGGRFVLGLGAGFKARDYHEYRYEFRTAGQRIDDLAAGLDRVRHRLAVLTPPPLRRIPILVGGSGEQRTLPLVAAHADIWHTFAEGSEFVRKSHLLDGYCHQLGRDPVDIERSVLVAGDPGTVGVPLLHAGATLFVVSIPSRPKIDLAPVADWLQWRDTVSGQRL